jgi:cytochrome b subunit of formate dehydrogenase
MQEQKICLVGRFNSILDFLDGKKTYIIAIASAIIVYLMTGNLISDNLGALLQTIMSILAGGAVIATNRLKTFRSEKK